MDPTCRFSNRVSDYMKYRPGYPSALLGLLTRECGLTPFSLVADIGSGTGKLTELFLSNGNTVFAVEPNREMRAAAEELLGGTPGFRSVEGRAEETGLGDLSVDMISAGQAFHWFDRDRSAAELRRILRPQGYAVLVWNDRERSGSPFLLAYEEFLRAFSTDYGEVSARGALTSEALGGFFKGPYGKAEFPNAKDVDFQGLLGRYLSASYALTRDHPAFPVARERLEGIFRSHEEKGLVRFSYVTRVYYGRFARGA
jgi:SAM-dependent methyltransferase